MSMPDVMAAWGRTGWPVLRCAAPIVPMLSRSGWVIFSGWTGVWTNVGLGTQTLRPVTVMAHTPLVRSVDERRLGHPDLAAGHGHGPHAVGVRDRGRTGGRSGNRGGGGGGAQRQRATGQRECGGHGGGTAL